jgi:uncharacterized repeat protein (TIGR01451 family)
VINCTVNDTAVLDRYLTNNVTLDWTENQGLIHRDNATIYVPPIDFRKAVNVTEVSPGGWVQWSIYFDNYLGSTIDTIWINETLPNNMTYQSDNSTQCSIKYSGDSKNVTKTIIGWTKNGYEISYKFTNVTSGMHYFVINCSVNNTVDYDVLTNNVTFECSEDFDTLFASESVSIIPEFTNIFVPIFFFFIAIIITKPKIIINSVNNFKNKYGGNLK